MAGAVGDSGKWSFEDMLPYFKEQENNDTFHNKYHGAEGGLAVQLPHGINELNQRCLRAFQEVGLEYNPDYNGVKQVGVSPVQSTVGNNHRCSAADAYLKTFRFRAGGHSDRNRSQKIIFKDKRAVGVEVISGHKTHQIFADEVILSAGAIHSPRLLMLSGVGPKEHLQSLGIEVVLDAPDVGENFHDHAVVPLKVYVKGTLGYQAAAHGLGTLKAGIRYLTSHEGPASGNGVETVSYFDPTNLNSDEATIQCYHVPIISSDGLTPTGNRSGLTFEIVVLRPKSRGWVRLQNADYRTMPLINPNYMADDEDLKTTVEAVKLVREVIKQHSLSVVVEEEMEPGPAIVTDKQIAEWIKKVTTTMWHPVGTCRMGQDEHAVVDARLKVNGLEGLHIIDASIMPNITSGNTNAPTQALALHGVKMFVEDLHTL